MVFVVFSPDSAPGGSEGGSGGGGVVGVASDVITLEWVRAVTPPLSRPVPPFGVIFAVSSSYQIHQANLPLRTSLAPTSSNLSLL